MMKNKKIIVFLESGFFFSQLIWENGAFGAPVRAPRGLGRQFVYILFLGQTKSIEDL
jgi:hypothetical protein